MVILAALTGTGYGPEAWWAGGAAWLAGVLLWPKLLDSQKKQAVLLSGCGVIFFLACLLGGGRPVWIGVLTQNVSLLGMLGAVSFLQLINSPDVEEGVAPKGRIALWKTAFGVHLVGAVINIPAIFIMAERMRSKGNLQPEQAMLLCRAFLAAALWSPFFAATAIALTYAPGANPLRLVAFGGGLAAVLLVIGILDVERKLGNNADSFVGYPIHLRALRVPAFLSIFVAAGHWLLPNWTALSVISIASFAVVFAELFFSKGLIPAVFSLVSHSRERLPGMSGELILFLSAGVFASGLQSLIGLGGIWMPFKDFGATEASIILAMMILLSVFGIHAVISITIMAAWLAPIHPNSNLLALVFAQSWAIGLAAGPLSGIHVAIQGRFGIASSTLSRGNAFYCLQAYVFAVLWLVLCDNF